MRPITHETNYLWNNFIIFLDCESLLEMKKSKMFFYIIIGL